MITRAPRCRPSQRWPRHGPGPHRSQHRRQSSICFHALGRRRLNCRLWARSGPVRAVCGSAGPSDTTAWVGPTRSDATSEPSGPRRRRCLRVHFLACLTLTRSQSWAWACGHTLGPGTCWAQHCHIQPPRHPRSDAKQHIDECRLFWSSYSRSTRGRTTGVRAVHRTARLGPWDLPETGRRALYLAKSNSRF